MFVFALSPVAAASFGKIAAPTTPEPGGGVLKLDPNHMGVHGSLDETGTIFRTDTWHANAVAYATRGFNTGRYYMESRSFSGVRSAWALFGLIPAGYPMDDDWVGNRAGGIGLSYDDGAIYSEYRAGGGVLGNVSNGNPITENTIYGMRCDFTAWTVGFNRDNGPWSDFPIPAPAGTVMYPSASSGDNGDTLYFMFDHTKWSYAPPAGFVEFPG